MAAPIDLSEGVSGAAKKNWTRLNHLHVEGMQTTEGYAYCENCGAVENEEAAAQPCRKGPVLGHRYDVGKLLHEGGILAEEEDRVSEADLLSHGIEEAGSAIAFGLTESAAALGLKQ